jgi:hypothetical protein
MNPQPKSPNTEARAKSVNNLQAVGRQLDMLILTLDEAIALADRDLLAQRRARLEKRVTVHNTQAISGDL